MPKKKLKKYFVYKPKMTGFIEKKIPDNKSVVKNILNT